jgi:hypothetical protein
VKKAALILLAPLALCLMLVAWPAAAQEICSSHYCAKPGCYKIGIKNHGFPLLYFEPQYDPTHPPEAWARCTDWVEVSPVERVVTSPHYIVIGVPPGARLKLYIDQFQSTTKTITETRNYTCTELPFREVKCD